MTRIDHRVVVRKQIDTAHFSDVVTQMPYVTEMFVTYRFKWPS